MSRKFSPDTQSRAQRPFYNYDRAWLEATTAWTLLYYNATGSGMVLGSLAFNNKTAVDQTVSIAYFPDYVPQLPPSNAQLDANLFLTDQAIKAKEHSGCPTLLNLRPADSLWIKASAATAIMAYMGIEEEQ